MRVETSCFFRKYGLYDFMCTCCTPDSDLEAMQRNSLNHIGISVTLSVTLCSYLMHTLPHQRETHIPVCYFHPTLKLLFRILPLFCVVLYYTALFWQGIGFYKTSNRIVSMTHTCTSRSTVYELHSTEYSSQVHWGHLDSATYKKWLVHCSCPRFSSENAIAMWASVPTQCEDVFQHRGPQ
jgi:hypothetical protein